MTKDTKRTALLLVALLAVGALVVLDRMSGSGGAAEGEDAPASLADRYRQEASRAAVVAAGLESAQAWEDALADAERRWDEASGRMIHAGSVDIAFVRLREVVESAMRDVGLRLDSSVALPVEAPMEGEALRVIGMRMEFLSTDPQGVYTLVDRLENLPEVATNVAGLRVAGPGRLGRDQVSVVIELRALAWIGPEV
jgi:hypothetical protein